MACVEMPSITSNFKNVQKFNRLFASSVHIMNLCVRHRCNLKSSAHAVL